MKDGDETWMREALRLARRGYGSTSPNPMVGAMLVRGGRVLGGGWHHAAGQPHAEIEALQDARSRQQRLRGACLYVTLEPCCTHGRTPPCTEAILAAGIRRVVVGAIDPNPAHCGRGLEQLRSAGLEVREGVLAASCAQLNESFNHWIVHRTPWVTLKAAMTLDGKIADAQGRSRWITGPAARRHVQYLRAGVDAILVGLNTVVADNPALTVRGRKPGKTVLRVVLDSRARIPPGSQVLTDHARDRTLVIVSRLAPPRRVRDLQRKVQVWVAPRRSGRLDLPWILRRLGAAGVTSLLVEGGGEVHGSFLDQHLAHRIAFFYAPKLLLGRDARPAVGGAGAENLRDMIPLTGVSYRRFGEDLFLTGLVRAAT